MARATASCGPGCGFADIVFHLARLREEWHRASD
jgi:hypothetical protein